MTRNRYILYTIVFLMVSILVASSLPSVSYLVPRPDTESGIVVTETGNVLPETRSPVYAPQIVCDENTTKSAYPMDIVTFNCTVRNLGNVTDDYEVVSTTIHGWYAIPYPERFIQVPVQDSNAPDWDKNRSFNLKVIVGDLYNATVGKYTFDVTVRSTMCSSNRSTLTFTIDVLLVHVIEITPPEPEYRLPGEDVRYEFTVQNLGNGDAEYDLWTETSDEEWVALLVDDTQEVLKIQQGRIVVVPVIVYLPEDVDGGTCQITYLCVKPHEDPNASATCASVQTMVTIPCQPFDMRMDVRKQAGKLEDTLTFTVYVTFNKEVDGVTFLMSEQPSNWSVEIDDSNIPEWGGTKDLEYEIYAKVSIPHSTPVGRYNFTLDGYLTGPPLKFVDCVNFKVDVLPTYRAEMGFNESEKTAAEEENVPFSALLTNTGNIECSYNWTLSCHNVSWIDVAQGEYSLAPGEIREIEFNVLAPIYTPAGPYEFEFQLHSANESNISFEHTFVLNVSSRLDFEFVTLEELHYVNPGEESFVDIGVINTGNANVTISFDMMGEPWAFLIQKNLFIPYRGTENLSLRIAAAGNVTPGRYTFQVTGRVTTRPQTSFNISLEIITPHFEFACSDIFMRYVVHGLPQRGFVGDTVSFYLEIFNKGEQYYDLLDHGANLSVTIMLGGEPIHPVDIPHLDAGSSVWVNFSHTFLTEGTYRLNAEINADRVLHESNYSDNHGAGEITIIEKETDDTVGNPGDDDTFFGRKLSVLLAIVLIIFICSIIITGALILIKRKYPPEL